MDEKITHCINGHEFTKENTRFKTENGRKTARRECIECRRERDRKYRAQRKAKRLESGERPTCQRCGENPINLTGYYCTACRIAQESPDKLDPSLWKLDKKRGCMVYTGPLEKVG